MKNWKRFCALFLTGAMLLSSFTIPVIAESTDDKETDEVTQYMDCFEPMPIVGELSEDCWGVPDVGPRDQGNGLEDRDLSDYCYWDGAIIKNDENGKYYMFASRWNQAGGHWGQDGISGWQGSQAIYAISDDLYGPYEDMGPIWPDWCEGAGHNVFAFELSEDDPLYGEYRYAISISDTGMHGDIANGTIQVSDSLDGPWTHLGKMPIEGGDFGLSNISIVVRPDGRYEAINRNGDIAIADTIEGPWTVVENRLWWKMLGMSNVNIEDPVIWHSDGLYHVVVNKWDARRAYYMTSEDGITNWKLHPGTAYTPDTQFLSYEDGTENNWTKLERPNVYIEDGTLTAMTFAVIDVQKEEDFGNDQHGSKIIVVPFDGEKLKSFAVKENPLDSREGILPIEDTNTQSWSTESTLNYGGEPYFQVQRDPNWANQGMGQLGEGDRPDEWYDNKIAYLKYDISEFVEGNEHAELEKAELSLVYVSKEAGNATSNQLQLTLASTDWIEGTGFGTMNGNTADAGSATWDNQPEILYDADDMDGTSIISESFSLNTTAAEVKVDVTKLVKLFMEENPGETVMCFAINEVNTGNRLRFGTREAGDTYGPKLNIEFVKELPYIDVTENDWFFDSVYYNYATKIMTGKSEMIFAPYENLSRAQFALMLYRMENSPEFSTEKTFGDVTGSEWYGQAVLWAAENSIVTGYQDGNFGPTDNITREQIAVMMYRYAKYLGLDVETDADYSAFKDAASVSEFAEAAMKWAYGNGIITGKENGTILDPQGNTARCETAAIIERFMTEYLPLEEPEKPEEPEEPEKPEDPIITEKTMILDFDFDDTETGLAGAGAKATGNAILQDSYEDAGKAVYFNGTNSSILTITKESGSSLLTGYEELTISFDVKSDGTDTNWWVYAAPNANSQSWPYEHYIGIMEANKTLTIERFDNNGSRPEAPTVAMADGWNHYDIVFTTTETIIYENGSEVSTVASTYGVDDILGKNSILYLGKANWGTGEYCKGWMDNLKIYNYALTKEELRNVPTDAYKEIFLEQAKSKIDEMKLTEAEVVLPDYNGTVTWKSDRDDVVIADDGITATVHQPAEGEEAIEGKLTAVLNVYGKTVEIEVPVTIRPVLGEDDPYGYLMVHHMQTSDPYGERIYLDISRGDNPEQWDPLNGGEAILVSDQSTTGIRDPYITYSPETETYYILATDLRVYGGDNLGWGEWQKSYSTKINIWESKDLITWSELRQFDVALNQEGEKVAELGMMWAPEATWVPDYYEEGKGAFVMYWSSQVYDNPEHSGSSYAHIMWGATSDFTQETYEYGGVFVDPGEARIDMTIIQDNGTTYQITKNESNRRLYMESTTDEKWWLPEAEWTRIQTDIGLDRYGSLEGPAVFKDHSEEGRFYLFVDNYSEYKPMVTDNIDEGWVHLDSSDYFLTGGTKHGGVISLTKGQYDALRAADAKEAVEENLGQVEISAGTSEEDAKALLPKTAEVVMEYDLGTSELPVIWDLSGVNFDENGTYEVTGVVQSIGANDNQWVGDNNSTSYDAPNKVLYSTREIEVIASVIVK